MSAMGHWYLRVSHEAPPGNRASLTRCRRFWLDAEVYTDLALMTTGSGSYARRCPVSSGMLLLCQAMAKSEGHGGSPVLASCLVENVRQMMGYCFLAETQLLTDLGTSHSLSHQAQYLHLACCQPGSIGW
jgi:hypothetical protein